MDNFLFLSYFFNDKTTVQTPCLLMSEDGGDSWHLVTTGDLVPGIRAFPPYDARTLLTAQYEKPIYHLPKPFVLPAAAKDGAG